MYLQSKTTILFENAPVLPKKKVEKICLKKYS